MANGHIPQLGKGVLFQNDKKTSEKSPDYKGTLLLSRDYKAGQTLKISGWYKKTPQGHLISLSEDNWVPKPIEGEAQQYPREMNIDKGEIPW